MNDVAMLPALLMLAFGTGGANANPRTPARSNSNANALLSPLDPLAWTAGFLGRKNRQAPAAGMEPILSLPGAVGR